MFLCQTENYIVTKMTPSIKNDCIKKEVLRTQIACVFNALHTCGLKFY